jgi:hypothetical protein
MSLDEELAHPPLSKKDKLGKLVALLERSGIDVDDIGRVEKISVWQGFLKNEEGEAEMVDLASVVLSPVWEQGPQYPVVQQAAPTTIRPVATKPKTTDAKVTVVLPDPQIGFRRMSDDALVPMHDEEAMNVALQMMRFIRPDAVVNLGDFIDLPEWSSKFLVLPEFVLTTQPSVDRAHKFLAEQRAVVGDEATIVLIGGNHDDRLPKAVARNAMAAMRLKQANLPNSFPVLSLPFLLRLDEMKVSYFGAYPASRYKIASGGDGQTPLYAIHGERLDVQKVAKNERQSFVQGHIHRIAVHSETFEVADAMEQVIAFSPGCLCRVDGAVPSTKSGVDDVGMPIQRFESWQQGIAVVTELPSGRWTYEIVPIIKGEAVFRGRVFNAS